MASKKAKQKTVLETVPKRPDFHPYLKSIAEELRAIQHRVRLLINNHWLTDGHYKETILRNLLRKHLPESVLVGNGFVVSNQRASGEIDILIVDRNMPTLFKEDELLIVTPESVRAIIEVKTRIQSPKEIKEVIGQLAERKQVAASHVSNPNIWAGLFVYDGEGVDRHKNLLEALYETGVDMARTIDCVAFGADTLTKYFQKGLSHNGVWPDNAWHSFHVPGVAPSMFISSLITHLMPDQKDHGSFAWDAIPSDGKRKYIVSNRRGASIHGYDEWLANNAQPSPLGMGDVQSVDVDLVLDAMERS